MIYILDSTIPDSKETKKKFSFPILISEIFYKKNSPKIGLPKNRVISAEVVKVLR